MIKLIAENRSNLFGISTVGLNAVGQTELHVEVVDAELAEEAERFLNYVASYLLTSGNKILSGESVEYGYWSVKF